MLKRKTPIKKVIGWPSSAKDLSRRSSMNRVGKKTKAWDTARAELKKRFAAVGVVKCEVCGDDFALSFMHRKPRRYCDANELHIVALGCVGCHTDVDLHGHAHMFKTVNDIINNRSNAANKVLLQGVKL